MKKTLLVLAVIAIFAFFAACGPGAMTIEATAPTAGDTTIEVTLSAAPADDQTTAAADWSIKIGDADAAAATAVDPTAFDGTVTKVTLTSATAFAADDTVVVTYTGSGITGADGAELAKDTAAAEVTVAAAK